MTPAEALKLTKECDFLPWLAYADYCDEQGVSPEPWRTAGQIAIALKAWLDAYCPVEKPTGIFRDMHSSINILPDYYLDVCIAGVNRIHFSLRSYKPRTYKITYRRLSIRQDIHHNTKRIATELAKSVIKDRASEAAKSKP